MLSSKQKGLSGPAPDSVRAAEKALATAQRKAEAGAAGAEAEVVEARYGKPLAPMTASVDRILQSGAWWWWGLRCG